MGEQRDPCIFHIIAAGNFQNYISFWISVLVSDNF